MGTISSNAAPAAAIMPATATSTTAITSPTISSAAVVLHISNLSKYFRTGKGTEIRAVNHVSVTVRRGEVVAILGENGAGKTTLIDMILGLTRPTSGSIEVHGHSPRDAVDASEIGAILQTGGLLPDITVSDTLRMVASGYPAHVPLEDVVKQARLEELLDRKVGKCSGGEQQRVKFALALLGDPGLIVLDEPTTGMDPSARRDFWADIHARAARGTTILFTTHYMDEAEDFAKRVVMLHKGRVLADLDTQSMLALSESAFVQASFPKEVPDLSTARSATMSDIDATTAPIADVITEITEIKGAKASERDRRIDTHQEHSVQASAARPRTFQFRTCAPDTVLRYLVTQTEAFDFKVHKASLDDVFISLQHEADQQFGNSQVATHEGLKSRKSLRIDTSPSGSQRSGQKHSHEKHTR